MIYLAADFETSVEEDYNYHIEHNDNEHTRVYLWCVQELFDDCDKFDCYKIGEESTIRVKNKIANAGYDIKSFMQYLEKLNDNCVVYFHNLKFDGAFIRYWLIDNGYKFVDLYNVLKEEFPDEVEYDLCDLKYENTIKKFNFSKQPGTYEYLITNTGVWHYLNVYFKDHRVIFRDSLKLFNTSLEELLKAHNTYEKIKVRKTSLDVEKLRAPKYEVSEEELVRCKNDTIGLAYVLGLHLLDKKSEAYLSSNTIGGCAINRYIGSLSKEKKKRKRIEAYKELFPELSTPLDDFIRASYRGGWSYVNPLHAGKILEDVEVYDMNSMYPTAMTYDKMPYGLPILKREYDTYNFDINKVYEDADTFPENSFYVIQFTAAFIIKKDGLPFLLKNNRKFSNSIYFDHCVLTLPEPLYILLKENYNVVITSPTINIVVFRAKAGLFKDYIFSLYDKKQKYGNEGNRVLKDTYKLLMNSLYGKFGQRRRTYHKIEHNNTKINTEIPFVQEYKKDYTPVASAITGYSKLRLTRVARSFGDRFIYTDTDSIHILKGDLGEFRKQYDKDNTGQLGLWKLEHTFQKAKYLHSKCYIGVENGVLRTTVAGLKKQNNPILETGEPVTLENFKTGAMIEGNLKPVIVPGGVILKKHPFEIREQNPYADTKKLLEVIRIGGFNDPYYYSKDFIVRYTYRG